MTEGSEMWWVGQVRAVVAPVIMSEQVSSE